MDFDEIVRDVKTNPSAIITLDVIVKHGDFIRLLVNGNATLEKHLMLLIAETALLAYNRALSDSVIELQRVLDSAPEIPILTFVMENEDESND